MSHELPRLSSTPSCFTHTHTSVRICISFQDSWILTHSFPSSPLISHSSYTPNFITFFTRFPPQFSENFFISFQNLYYYFFNQLISFLCCTVLFLFVHNFLLQFHTRLWQRLLRQSFKCLHVTSTSLCTLSSVSQPLV